MENDTEAKIYLNFPFFAGVSYSQNCNNYHINNCRWADISFLYSRQSKSAVFTPGMRSEFMIVVYGGEEYYMSVDSHRKLGDIRLRVYEDNKSKKPLYTLQSVHIEG